jgi:hypothetical protein
MADLDESGAPRRLYDETGDRGPGPRLTDPGAVLREASKQSFPLTHHHILEEPIMTRLIPISVAVVVLSLSGCARMRADRTDDLHESNDRKEDRLDNRAERVDERARSTDNEAKQERLEDRKEHIERKEEALDARDGMNDPD